MQVGGFEAMIWLSAACVLILILIYLPFSVTMQVAFSWPTAHFSVTVRYLFMHYTYRSKKHNPQSGVSASDSVAGANSGQPVASTPTILPQVDQIFSILTDIKRYLSTVRVTELCWTTELGVGDASKTAVLCGLAWTFKGMIIGILADQIDFQREPEIDIRPKFSTVVCTTDARCILKSSLGKAMFAGWRLYRLLRSRKARDAHAAAGSSHSIPDADGNGEFERNGGRQHDHR